jgi:sugar lactone lactonase YvrE
VTQPVTALTDTPLALGEGARSVGGRLVLVDILAGDLYAHPADRPAPLQRLLHVDLPLGAVAPVGDRPGAWVAAVGDGVALLVAGEAPQWLGRPEAGHGGRTRMNDGVCDPRGRFWASSMAYDGESPLGSLYRVDPDGTVHQVLDDLVIANGPAFSPDGATMYLADSGRATVTRHRVAPDGTLADPVVLFHEESAAVPDGMTTDASGALWVAMWGGSEVRRYSPDGDLLARVPLPASQPTSVALVDRWALLTTASLGLEQPGRYDGLLLSVDLAALGIEVAAAPTAGFG